MVRRLSSALIIATLVQVLVVQTARASSPDDKADSKKDSATIAVFRLHGQITESPQDEDFFFGSGRQLSLKDLVVRLKKAAEDKNVKAVVFLAEGEAPGSAQIEEVRQAMAQIRSAGKEIYVHADSLSMRDYVLLSGASRISVVPTGDVWITGLYGETPFIRGLLDKLGVKPEFLTCGAYKSAAELFMRESASPEAEQMQNWLFDSLYKTYVHLIASGRGVDATRVKAWIDGGPYVAEKAKDVGLIDVVEERQDFTRDAQEEVWQGGRLQSQVRRQEAARFRLLFPVCHVQDLGRPAWRGQEEIGQEGHRWHRLCGWSHLAGRWRVVPLQQYDRGL